MNNIKILIVEDEAIIALDIKNTILKLNYLVTDIVSNYEDTFKSINKNKPDIIFMDINLGGDKTGIDIVNDIHKEMKIPIIYLTAFSDDTTMQKAIATNPISYVLKPFKREEIKSNILLAIYKINDRNDEFSFQKHTPIGLGYCYDLQNDNLFFKDQPIQISHNEKKFLRILISANGFIVPFAEIEQYMERQ